MRRRVTITIHLHVFDDRLSLIAIAATLAADAEQRQRFGAASRALVESDLAQEAVGAATVALYRSPMEQGAGAGRLPRDFR